jgi:hypothetical protein
MHSITLLSFLYPRQFRASAAVPVIVILHFSNSIHFPTIQAFLGHGTGGISATCMPVDFGEGKPCPDVSLHPIFATFLRRSSKDILGPAVDPNLEVRVDVVGDSDADDARRIARQASIAAHEPRSRAWAFDAAFDSSIHPALVSDNDEIAANYIQEMLNMADDGSCVTGWFVSRYAIETIRRFRWSRACDWRT